MQIIDKSIDETSLPFSQIYVYGNESWSIKIEKSDEQYDEIFESTSRKALINANTHINEVRRNIWAVLLKISGYYGAGDYDDKKFSEEDLVRLTAPNLNVIMSQNTERIADLIGIPVDYPDPPQFNSRHFKRTIKLGSDKWKLINDPKFEDMGEMSPDKREITVKTGPDIIINEVKTTIFHEILHVCGYYAGIDEGRQLTLSKWVDHVSPTLSLIMQDNKKLIYQILSTR